MATVKDLRDVVFRAGLLFLLINTSIKFYGRVGNGFDLLAVFVAAVAVASPFLKDFSFILEMVVIGVAIGALSYRAGASRRGLLFLSAITIFSEAMVDSRAILGDLEDVDPCAPAKVGAAGHFLLLCMLSYVALGQEDHFRMSREEEEQKEMQLWILCVVLSNCARALATTYVCPKKDTPLEVLAHTLRLILVVTACVAQGADETKDNVNEV